MVTLNCACITEPDLAAVHQIARLHLCMRRCGCELRLFQPNEDLVALIELAGLAGVLRVEVQRKAEERKQPGRVEEEGELRDPAV